jgi:cell division protein FtsL
LIFNPCYAIIFLIIFKKGLIMSVLDRIKERRKKIEEEKKEIQKLKSGDIYDQYKLIAIATGYSNMKDITNKMVARFCTKTPEDEKRILKVLDSFGDNKWWLSKDPEVLAVQQLKLGKTSIVLSKTCLEAAVTSVRRKPTFYNHLEENWEQLFEEIKELLGEDKIKDITYTEEDWQRELDEALKIDLDYYNQ